MALPRSLARRFLAVSGAASLSAAPASDTSLLRHSVRHVNLQPSVSVSRRRRLTTAAFSANVAAAVKVTCATAVVKEEEEGKVVVADKNMTTTIKSASCGPDPVEEDEDEMEEMFVMGPSGTMEWGGPTRGGQHKEPTRYGDWERKGRCSDFS